MPTAGENKWYRFAHMAIFAIALVLMYFVMGEVLRAANVINPVRWITNSGRNPDNETYKAKAWAAMDRDRASDVHDAWESAWRDNTKLVREFRTRHKLSDLTLDEDPSGKRIPVVLAPQFDDYVYPSDPSRNHAGSDMYGLIFGQWKSAPKDPGVSEWQDLATRVARLENGADLTRNSASRTRSGARGA